MTRRLTARRPPAKAFAQPPFEEMPLDERVLGEIDIIGLQLQDLARAWRGAPESVYLAMWFMATTQFAYVAGREPEWAPVFLRLIERAHERLLEASVPGTSAPHAEEPGRVQ